MKNQNAKERRPVVAMVDLGSNSVRLLVVRIDSKRSHTVLTRYKQMVRLGEGVFETKRLSGAAMERTSAALCDIADICREYGVAEVSAYTTAALRDAENAREFVERAERETGIRIAVISGIEEARLIRLGVASAPNYANEGIGLFVDIGGGSTELSVGRGMDYSYLDSLEIGAVRVAGHFTETAGPGVVSQAVYKKIREHVKNNAPESLQKLKGMNCEFMVGSSGTVVNLVEMASRAKKNGASETGEDALTLKALADIASRLCALTLEERRKFPGINPQRADIIIAGAAILHTLMEESGMDSIAASNRGLLEGMLVDRLSRGGPGRTHKDFTRGDH